MNVRARAAALLLLACAIHEAAGHPGPSTPEGRILSLRCRARYSDAAGIADSLAAALQARPERAGAREAAVLARVRHLRDTLHAIAALPESARRELAVADSIHAAFDPDSLYLRPMTRAAATREIKILTRWLGPEHAWTARGHVHLAFGTGGEEGRASLRRAIEISEKNRADWDPDYLLALIMLGRAHGDRGDPVYGESLLRRLIAIADVQLSDAEELRGSAHANYAWLLMARGRYEDAEREFRTGLEIYGRAYGDRPHFNVTSSLQGIGLLHWIRGDLAGGESYLRQALEIMEGLYGPGWAGLQNAIVNLAVCMADQGRYDDAEALFARLSAIVDPLPASALRHHGHVLQVGGRLEEARETLREAARRSRSADPKSDRQMAETLCALGAVHHRMGEYAAAESALVEAAGAYESARAKIGGGIDRATFTMPSPYARLAAVRLRLDKEPAAWEAAERDLARSLAELRHPGRGGVLPLERIQSALDARSALVGWIEVEESPGLFASFGYVIRSEGPVRWIRLPELAAGVSPYDFAAAYRSQLAEAPGLLGGDARGREGPTIRAARWDPLEPHLQGVSAVAVVPSGAMLGIPLESLPDGTGGFLMDRYDFHYVPSASLFAMLATESRPAGAPGRVLLVGGPAGSAGEVGPAIADAVRRPPAPVLRAALRGDAQALSELPPLPASRDEVMGIAALYGSGAKVLLGADACEDSLRRLAAGGALRGFRTIHFATHALIDEDQPGSSALILSEARAPRSGAPDPSMVGAPDAPGGTDGLLSADELTRDWRLDADLVTLSACETGLGRERNSSSLLTQYRSFRVSGNEGYVGFAHAFIAAGARSLVVSLWKVDDRATALLMLRFHENLTGRFDGVRRGVAGRPMRRTAALAEAKEWLRGYSDRDGGRPYESPFYWSAFVLIGDGSS